MTTKTMIKTNRPTLPLSRLPALSWVPLLTTEPAATGAAAATAVSWRRAPPPAGDAPPPAQPREGPVVAAAVIASAAHGATLCRALASQRRLSRRRCSRRCRWPTEGVTAASARRRTLLAMKTGRRAGGAVARGARRGGKGAAANEVGRLLAARGGRGSLARRLVTEAATAGGLPQGGGRWRQWHARDDGSGGCLGAAIAAAMNESAVAVGPRTSGVAQIPARRSATTLWMAGSMAPPAAVSHCRRTLPLSGRPPATASRHRREWHGRRRHTAAAVAVVSHQTPPLLPLPPLRLCLATPHPPVCAAHLFGDPCIVTRRRACTTMGYGPPVCCSPPRGGGGSVPVAVPAVAAAQRIAAVASAAVAGAAAAVATVAAAMTAAVTTDAGRRGGREGGAGAVTSRPPWPADGRDGGHPVRDVPRVVRRLWRGTHPAEALSLPAVPPTPTARWHAPPQ